MRFTTVTVAFLFFTTVFATPIFRTGADDAVSLVRRGPDKGAKTTGGSSTPQRQDSTGSGVTSPRRQDSTGSGVTSPRRQSSTGPVKKAAVADSATGQHVCKRADMNALYAALNPANVHHLFQENQYAGIYLLQQPLDGKHVVLKILQNGMTEEEQILEEITALRMNGQLIGWGHTPNRELYYIFMEYMGVGLAQTPFANNAQYIATIKQAALQRYHLTYGLIHMDANDNESNWTYRHLGNNVWQAELIDWEFYEIDAGITHYRPIDRNTAVVFDPRCGIFVPQALAHHLG